MDDRKDTTGKDAVKLTDLATGARAVIRRITGEGAFRRRLMEMGFLPGTPILVHKYAPFEDPGEYVIGGNHISLRRAEAGRVLVDATDGGDPGR